MTTLEFWGVFMEMGGRLLLTILAVDMMLLLILEITRHGNFKNARRRSKVSKGNSRRTNSGFERRPLFDGMEILAADKERLSPRPRIERTRPTGTDTSLFVTRGDGSRRIDGVTIDTVQGTALAIRLNKAELSETTDSEITFSHSLTGAQIDG